MFKDHVNATGWTEVVYVVSKDSLKDAATAMDRLTAARVKLLANYVTIEAVTVSQESPELLGDVAYAGAWTAEPNKAGVPTYPGGFKELDPDFATVASLTRLNAGTEYHRSLWMSGVPDDLTLDRVGKIIDPLWTDKWDLWAKVIANREFGIFAASKSRITSPVFAIKGVSLTGRVITLYGPYTGDPSKPVFVHGVKGRSEPKGAVPLKLIRPTGRFGIEAIAGNTVTISRPINFSDFIYESGGYLRSVVYDVFTIDSAVLGAIRKKSRGRPLDLLRGRSPVRYRR